MQPEPEILFHVQIGMSAGENNRQLSERLNAAGLRRPSGLRWTMLGVRDWLHTRGVRRNAVRQELLDDPSPHLQWLYGEIERRERIHASGKVVEDELPLGVRSALRIGASCDPALAAIRLNRCGLTTAQGRSWNAQRVRDVMRRVGPRVVQP